jgi:branched-chain amino acid transport system substrate-binding protein
MAHLPKNSPSSNLNRRQLLRIAGLGAAGVAIGGPLLAACSPGSGGTGGGGATKTLKIGFVSPITGPAAGFGEPDAYVLELARKAFANGLSIGDTKYDVTIIDKDGQSDPQRGSQVAQDLINSDQIDLMLTTSTPETVNPVSDACEAAGVPCISTVVPWEAWYFGRGAKPNEPSPFKFTYHFCFGVEQFRLAYTHLWPQVPTNNKVGVMWPNDADGNAIRQALGPGLTAAGYIIDDPGAYTDGTTDYTSQITRFKANDDQIFNTFPIPPDFQTFWQQAAQQGYKPKIVQIAKTGLFPSQVEALGAIGVGVASGAYWTPTYPYKSSLTNISSRDLGNGYQSSKGKQWSQQLGPSLALFDIAAAALQAAADPKDKQALAAAIGGVSTETPVGHISFGKGPNASVVTTPIIGGQWVKGTSYPLDFVLCENSADPNVPIAAQLKPYV